MEKPLTGIILRINEKNYFMKALNFYKFIHDNRIEFHWHTNSQTNEKDVIFFPMFRDIVEFSKLLSTGDFDDEGIGCFMKDGYFCFWAKDLLERHDIELTEIFGEDTNK